MLIPAPRPHSTHTASAAEAPNSPKTPRIAVVIPILNEARTLKRTLEAVAGQDYPKELYEVLVLDGGSTDDSSQIVSEFKSRGVGISVIANTKRTVAAALNLAARSTSADGMLWLSGHCVLSVDYLTKTAVAYGGNPRQVVGGRLLVTSAGGGIRARLNAMVLTSRFGTGMARLRFEREPGETRSVTFAVYDRMEFLRLGGLDERLIRNQDVDLLERLRQAGTGFRRVDATAHYIAPADFAGLWRRAWTNGNWNIWGMRLGRRGLSWWHFAPMAMVGVGALLLVAAPWATWARFTLTALAAVYTILALVSVLAAARQERAFWNLPLVPFLFFVHHLIYGLGSWTALFRPVPAPPGSSDGNADQRED